MDPCSSAAAHGLLAGGFDDMGVTSFRGFGLHVHAPRGHVHHQSFSLFPCARTTDSSVASAIEQPGFLRGARWPETLRSL